VPNWNGARWLPGCLASLRAQERAFDEVIVVDGGSTDGSLELLRGDSGVRVVELGRNVGFAAAANRGVAECAVGTEAVALINTDVELAADWLARVAGALGPGVGSVACKMVSLRDPSILDDTGNFLRRDGACEQRGRGLRDKGRWDEPGEVFSACAGAAVYRREAFEAAGGFDERFFSYLEDVDLGLRLRMTGWRCAYEPAVARHAGGGSSGQLVGGPRRWVARNTLLLVAKAFPPRWLGPVSYRQAAWVVEAARERRLREHLGGVGAGLRLLPAMLRERRSLRATTHVPIDRVVEARPWRGPLAGGHPESGF